MYFHQGPFWWSEWFILVPFEGLRPNMRHFFLKVIIFEFIKIELKTWHSEIWLICEEIMDMIHFIN